MSADFSFTGTANTYDVCEQIAVKAHLFPLDVTGKWPMVSMVKTAIGICGVSRCFMEYFAMLGRFFGTHDTLVDVLHNTLT